MDKVYRVDVAHRSPHVPCCSNGLPWLRTLSRSYSYQLRLWLVFTESLVSGISIKLASSFLVARQRHAETYSGLRLFPGLSYHVGTLSFSRLPHLLIERKIHQLLRDGVHLIQQQISSFSSNTNIRDSMSLHIMASIALIAHMATKYLQCHTQVSLFPNYNFVTVLLRMFSVVSWS